MASYFSSVALLVLLAAVLPCVHAFPSGAPATACESLTPGHRGQLPQTSAPPFAVRLEKNTYSPNEQIAVTLYSACNNEIFQGFMVQVRAVGSTAPVGFFTNAPQTRNVPGCGSFNQAMTHTGSSEKTEVALQWIAPDQSVGDVVVFATFLRNYQTFWVMVASAVIRDASSPSGGPSVSSEYPTRTVCQTAIPPPQPTRPPTRTTTTTTATTTTTTTTTTPAPTPRRIFTPPLPPVTTVRPQKEGTTTLPTVSKEANFPGNRTVQSSTTTRPGPTISPPQPTRPPAPTTTTTTTAATTTTTAPTPQRTPELTPTTTVRARSEAITSSPTVREGPNVHGNIQSGITTTTTTDVESAVSICGERKACYSWCSAGDCRFNITAEYTEDDVLIEMSSVVEGSNVWTAMGLSRDTNMGDDSVMECVQSGGRAGVYVSYNRGYNNDRIGQIGVSEETVSFVDGVLRCSFRRKLVVAGGSRVFDLRNKTQWYLFLASGPAQGNEKLKHANTPHISPEPVNLNKTGTVVQQGPITSNRLAIVRAHGSLMLVAWVFTTSFGIIVARYYKLLGGRATCQNNRYSFHVHRACMSITLVCVSVSIIIIFVEVGGLSKVSQTGSLFLSAHPILGLIVVSLVLINFSMGLLRPAPGRKVRPVYNWGHWATGTCAWITAMATIFLGFAMPQARIHPSANYVMVGFVGLYLFVQLFLEWLSYNVDKVPLDSRDKSKPGIYELTTMDGQNGRSRAGFELVEEPVSGVGRFKSFILCSYVFALFFLLLALLILVNTTFDKTG